MCGEQLRFTTQGKPLVGSPPRVRGTVELGGPGSTRSRITPACAGNRRRKTPSASGKRDHPRVCGEQPSPSSTTQQARGSPPRVRGTEFGDSNVYQAGRITPACAGNSSVMRRVREIGWDHPRVCGEQLVDILNQTLD